MDPSLPIGPGPGTSNSFLDRIPIETVIEIVRLSLLHVEYRPLVIMRRVEELRLVDRYWAKCIDQCPLFWTHITSQATSTRYTRWLKKSQNAPLHVECRSDEKFMELLLPHTARWQSLVFYSSSPDAWSSLTRPAPQLQELDLHFLPVFERLPELFQGATPRLNAIRLYGTLAPWHRNIFRDLRELVIDVSLRRDLGLCIELEDFLPALKSSPSLELLVIKGTVGPRIDRSTVPEPFTLASLRSFTFHSPAQDVSWSFAAYSLIAAIRFPSCTFVSIKYDSPTPALSEFPRDFWPTIVDVLRVTEAVDIILSPSRLSIVTRAGVSPHLNVQFTSASSAERMLIDLLTEAEFSQPLATEVYLTVESRDAFPPILEFLVKRTESGTERLPRLQELYVKLHMVPVETILDLILEHEELQSVLWSRSLTIGEGWSEPEEIKQRILDAPPQQRWLR
ncbi:hypothetical protein FS837_009303 [Tulasnella sp. UAMH 9824]|nr:hypothetical protein FS837_009303 [Tulasnella sp. UAMH 9824]